MHIIVVLLVLWVVIGFVRGFCGGHLPSLSTPARRPRDPMSPYELRKWHEISGTPGW